MSAIINSLTSLVDAIIAKNIETLDQYGIDLHNENLTVVSISPSSHIDRNTAVIVKADGPKVKLENTYYYNRKDLGVLLTESVSEVEFDALPTTRDEVLSLVNHPEFEAIPENDWEFYIYPSVMVIRATDSLGWFGSHHITITGEEEPRIDLAAFDQTVLGGFEQDAT